MVYLHVPFCRSFCTYCDFYSEIACRGRDAQLFEAYTQAVCAEASRRRDEIEATRDLNTLYIGGGTPSVLPLSHLERIVISILLSELAAESSRRGPRKSAIFGVQRRAAGNYFSDKFAEKPISAPLSAANSSMVPLSSTEFTIEVNPEDIVEKGED